MLRRIALAAAAFVSAAAVFAASDDVAVLYNGNTPPNVDGLHFISQQFADAGAYRAVGVKDPKEIQSGTYKAVVVLSTGLASGIDKKLADFIASGENKSRIILVSLRKGSKDLTALFGGKKSPEYEMHVAWVARVSALIDKMK